MPSSYTPQQKAQISQFVGFTSTKDSVAAKLEETFRRYHSGALDIAPSVWSRSLVPRLWIPFREARMLTAKEQWKILRKDERRTGRGRRKNKKALTEQLEDMGGFDHDSDSEQAITEELECRDTRAPLEHYQASYYECEVLFGESSFWRSRTRDFREWIAKARRGDSWMKEGDLPLLFRFALHRPIMDEWTFQETMEHMKLQLNMSTGDIRQPGTYPIGRSRQLILGIDVDRKTDPHVSRRLGGVLPKGATEDIDKAEEEPTNIDPEDDEDMQQLRRRQLWAVYEQVQSGKTPLERANWNYRDAFDDQDMSEETLITSLKQFGIPVDHVAASESIIHIREIKESLVNYISLYRGGGFAAFEIIPMIQDSLGDLKLDDKIISDILSDLEKDEETAASLMYEDALEACSSSSEEENEESDQDWENPLRAILVPIHEKEDHDAAAALQAMSIDGIPTNPKVDPPSKLPSYSDVDEVESRLLRPGTPRPKPASLTSATEQSHNQAEVDFDRGSPRDRADVGHRRLSSPDEGMTDGIWGLLMPTKEARKIAYKLGLPQDTIDDQVRSISPRRARRKRASHAKTVVTFPKRKRKASMALHKDALPKSPRRSDNSDLFAREGEDQKTFVLSHFDPDNIASEHTCIRCLKMPCECDYGFPPPSRPEPKCLECLQQPCLCEHFPQVESDTQTVPPKGSLSSDTLEITLADRTRPEPPKQSLTLLSYLGQMLGDVDVLASIKQLERRLPADTSIADAKVILDHIQQGICTEQKLDASGNDDREALGILQQIVQSSEILTNYSHELRVEVEEGPDDKLSLLNSSLDLECAAASAASFPENHSDIANGAILQINNPPLAKGVSPYVHISSPDSGVPHLETSSEIEDAVRQSRFQTVRPSKSSAAGDSSRAESHPLSPGGTHSTAGDSSRAENHPSSPGGTYSTAGSQSSETECPSQSPAGSSLSSTKDPSEQVSSHSVDAKSDSDNDGAPLTIRPRSDLRATVNGEAQLKPPPAPRPRARELRTTVSSPSYKARVNQLSETTSSLSQMPSSKGSPQSTPPAGLASKELSNKMNATAQSCLKSPVVDSLELWLDQPEIAGQAGMEWKDMIPTEALEYAKEEAFSQRKSLTFYLEERRDIRTRIKNEKVKKEENYANSEWFNHSFFQNSNGLSGSSGTATTQALNKLFDKYRENPAEEPDKVGIEGSMRYLADLGVKLDEVVVLAILTELGAPTMGEFTREGFVNGWQNHRAETLPKQQAQIASFRRSLAMTPDFFKRVYKQTFLIARLPGQKIVPLETALEYWRLLFTAPSLSWNIPNTPWLTFWLDYLETEWKKSISKDVWDQTGVFAMKSLEDESMSWWSEDGAWPGVLDDFVSYVREKRGGVAGAAGSEMDVG